MLAFSSAIGSVRPEASDGDSIDMKKLWSKDSVKKTMKAIDEPTPVFTPDLQCAKITAGTRLPGDKCAACKIRRVRMLQIMAPVIYSVQKFFTRMDGKLFGMAVGVLYTEEEEPTWYDVQLIIKKPMKILCTRLLTTVTQVFEDTSAGDLKCPKEAQVTIPDIRNGDDICLLEMLFKSRDVCPKYLLYPEKIGIFDSYGEWRCEFHDGFTVDPIHRKDVKDLNSTRNELAKLTKLLKHARDAEKVEGNLRFRTIWKEPDAAVDILGRPVLPPQAPFGENEEVPVADEASEDELVESDLEGRDSDRDLTCKLSKDEDDRVDVSHKFRNSINCDRYWVHFTKREGRLTVRWKDSEKENLSAKRDQVRRRMKELKPPRVIMSSHSCSIRRYKTLDECVRRCKLWQCWHTWWHYGEEPEEFLPESMPGPDRISSRRHQRASIPVRPHDTAPCGMELVDENEPGTPPSYCDSSKASTEDLDDSDTDETSELGSQE